MSQYASEIFAIAVKYDLSDAVTLHAKAEAAQEFWSSLEFEDEETGRLTEASEEKWSNFLRNLK